MHLRVNNEPELKRRLCVLFTTENVSFLNLVKKMTLESDQKEKSFDLPRAL